MNNWEDDALVLSRTFYSETSLILKVFSKHYGVRKGLVKGGKKINASYIFESGNLVNANWRGRNEEVLGNFRCELIKSNSALFLNDSLKFSALVAALNLIEYSLLENEPEIILYMKTLDLISKINSTNDWLKEYVIWELILLKKIGFGLSLEKCILTNSKKNLKFVSPNSGCAVSASVDEKWKSKLLVLPPFIINNQKPSIKDIILGLKLTQNFLEKFAISIGKKIPFTRDHFIDNIFIYHKIKAI